MTMPMTAIQDSGGTICTALEPCPDRKPVESRLSATVVRHIDQRGDEAGQLGEGEQPERRFVDEPFHEAPIQRAAGIINGFG